MRTAYREMMTSWVWCIRNGPGLGDGRALLLSCCCHCSAARHDAAYKAELGVPIQSTHRHDEWSAVLEAEVLSG